MQTSVRSAVVDGPAQLFAGILQPDDIRTEESERRAASSDIYGAGTTVDAVLQPRDARQLAAAVAAATRAGYAVVTRGGGMSYTGGYLAERPGTVLVDTLHLDRIVEISAEDLYITVEAGVTWKRIHEALAPLGLRLPFFGTFSGARATVGGGLSNGALFLGTARFGTAADCMLGMEVVLADGTLLRTGQRALRRARKPFYRTYGPDLSGLFIHDSGALGIKVQATFRLIRTPAHTGYASFVFDGMEAAGAALSEVARTGAAEEAYVFDPETTRKNLAGGNLSRDARTLLNVVRGESSLLKGVREGARLVAAGRDFMPADAYSLHVVCTGRSEAALEAELAACRTACESLGGREIVDSIPRAVRANLFPAPDGVLGPDGERWAALNAKVAHSDAAGIIRASRLALDPYRAEMAERRVWMSHLLIAIGTHAFSFEPVFHWYDEWLPIHERMPSAEHLATLKRPPADPAARELVARLRARLVEVFAELGAASNQIGKTYPYLESLEPATARLLRDLKGAVDPDGALNPGGLGLR
jgi:D-lactate dehydrogenase (cytochrome)